MRTTASYELFPDAPSERAMARARYLVREGRVADAEKAYRDLLAEHPDLKPGWAECFELLRSQGRTEDALRFAEAARAQFGDSAFSLALKGAALIELTRYRDALATLEQAVEFDPDLALVWHELGYAAFRLGDRNRALLALDRAFALEPHTETLRLRGRILRDAGRYHAALRLLRPPSPGRPLAGRALVRRDRHGGARPRPRRGGPGRCGAHHRLPGLGARFPLAVRSGGDAGSGAARLAVARGRAGGAVGRPRGVRRRGGAARRSATRASRRRRVERATSRGGPGRHRAGVRARARRRRHRTGAGSGGRDRRALRRRAPPRASHQRRPRTVGSTAPGGPPRRPPPRSRVSSELGVPRLWEYRPSHFSRPCSRPRSTP